MLRMFWWNYEPNFGDQLSPEMCALLSGRRVSHTKDFERCDLLAAGSILQLVPRCEQYRGYIWGSGLIEPPPTPCLFPRAKVRAVRGRLTRDLLGCGDAVALGDPGLLADLLARPAPKRYRLGVAPHYVDAADPLIRRFVDRSPHVLLIDVRAGVGPVLEAIAQCGALVASGMHPLIVADSLGIPNAWLKVSDKLWGGDFKFRDYYSVFGIADPRPLTLDATTTLDSVLAGLEGYARPGIERAKQKLRETFPFPRHWWSRWL